MDMPHPNFQTRMARTGAVEPVLGLLDLAPYAVNALHTEDSWASTWPLSPATDTAVTGDAGSVQGPAEREANLLSWLPTADVGRTSPQRRGWRYGCATNTPGSTLTS